MLLVSGALDADKRLTKGILEKLRDYFGFIGAKCIITHSKNPPEDQYNPRSKKSPVIGLFDGDNPRVDGGIIPLSSDFQKDAVYYISHLYNRAVNIGGEARQIDVSTALMQAWLFGDLLKEIYPENKLLCATHPLVAFGLSHSKERNKRLGLIESPILRRSMENYARSGYNEMIDIFPHSNKSKEYANDNGINYIPIDAFQDESSLGSILALYDGNGNKRENYKDLVKHFTPFVSRVKEKYGDCMDDVYFTSTDEGSEELIKRLAYACRGDHKNVIGLIKERDIDKVRILGQTWWSTADLPDIRGKICLVADDCKVSGETVNLTANELKNEEYKAKEVHTVIAHDQSFDTNITEHTSIDSFEFLETHPNSPIRRIDDPRINVMPKDTTEFLIAAAMVKSYSDYRDRGYVKVR